MNVTIFWVCAMKCMCAQTRPRFILSSERVFGKMGLEPMLTPTEKSPLPENVPRGGSNPWRCGQRAQALPTELFRPIVVSYCARKSWLKLLIKSCMINACAAPRIGLFVQNRLTILYRVPCLLKYCMFRMVLSVWQTQLFQHVFLYISDSADSRLYFLSFIFVQLFKASAL